MFRNTHYHNDSHFVLQDAGFTEDLPFIGLDCASRVGYASCTIH
jgi:hypothetical protein